jgi:hypothetical protein
MLRHGIVEALEHVFVFSRFRGEAQVVHVLHALAGIHLEPAFRRKECMAQGQSTSIWNGHRPAVVASGFFLVAAVLGLLTVQFGGIKDFEPLGIATASRTLNAVMSVAMTSIALILPLTANLYTPRLVKLYVTHPLIVGGLLILIVGNLLVMSLHFFPHGHGFVRFGNWSVACIYLVVLAGILPYLFGVSRFLRPSYFMPMLTRKGLRSLQELARGRRIEANKDDLFETIDVMTNVALTGMTRGDRHLVLLAMKSLHSLLSGIIGRAQGEASAWRDSRPWFVPGLAKEGQDFLIRERVWPEAYVLAQILKVSEVATRRQHELLSEMAGQLVDTARQACEAGAEAVIDLHVMTFNALLRESLEERDLRRFQNLSYHFRLLVEVFHRAPERMHDAVRHLMHYARLAAREGLHFAFETVVYDLGELSLSIGQLDEERAVELIQAWSGPVWQEAIAQDSGMQKVGWRTLLRTHWEARARGLKEIADAIYWRFLTDAAIHREQLELLLEENRELHYEFNDRLMRFAHLSPAAVAEAQAFLEQW